MYLDVYDLFNVISLDRHVVCFLIALVKLVMFNTSTLELFFPYV